MHTEIGTVARWWFGVGAVVLAVLVIAPVAGQTTKPAKTPWAAYTKLSQDEHSASVRMSGDADLARADFEKRYAWHPGATEKPDSDDAKKEATKVLAAYQAVLDLYPGTEITAYTAIRMAGFYGYIGQPDKTLDVMKDVAFMYERTPYGPKVAFELGLHYIQREKKPEEAIEWLRKIPMPDGLPIEDSKKLDETGGAYIRAQLQVIKAILVLQDKPDEAKIVLDDLKELFPFFADSLDQNWKGLLEEAESVAREKAKRQPAATQPRATTRPAR